MRICICVSIYEYLYLRVSVCPATAELPGSVWYTYGVKDAFTTFFYALIFIVVHAVVQEYIFDVRLPELLIPSLLPFNPCSDPLQIL